jgi:hypothetical protein
MPYYVQPFTFRFADSTILVDSGITDVDCYTLYDAIKLAQASEEGIIYERIGKGSGLNDLGPGVQVGITVELLGSWNIYFEPGNYVARVAGGNLVGGPSGDPVAYSPGVQALLIQSANATVVTAGGGGGGSSAADIWAYPTRTLSSGGNSSVATAVRSNMETELQRIDVAISSRNAVAPDNANIAAIKAKTDNLPADPAKEETAQKAVDAANLAVAVSS